MENSINVVEQAKELLRSEETARIVPIGTVGLMQPVKACYQAMLGVTDFSWRNKNDVVLAMARNSLASILNRSAQEIQDHYERKLQEKKTRP